MHIDLAKPLLTSTMQLIRIVFFCLLGICLNVDANQSKLEYKIKAAYLYNFTKFIEWPKKDLDTFNLCILGEDPFGSSLVPLMERKALGKPIKLIQIKYAEEIRQCHILYTDHEASYAGTLKKLSEPGILVVTSLEDAEAGDSHPFFSGHGGMIAFIVKDGRVKLQLKLSQLKKKGMNASAKLMEVVEQVNGTGDE